MKYLVHQHSASSSGRARVGREPRAARPFVLSRGHGTTIAALAAMLMSPTLCGGSASAQGLGYTLTPAATSVRWADALGIRNSSLFGGQLAFDFERYVSLQGFYFTNDGVGTAIDRLGLTGDLATRLANQKLDVRFYGANLLLNLGSGRVVPFVKGGGGVMEFRPAEAAAGTVNAGPTRQAALTVGGGLQLAILGPVRLDVFVDDVMLRVNRYALAAQNVGAPSGEGQVPPDPEQGKTRHNLAYGAGISIPFGPSRDRSGPSQLHQWGLSGTSFAFEPIVGRLFFSDEAGIGDQDVAGARAGFDVGRLVGIRGFYWRGTNSGFTRTEPIESWGAEAQMRLNSGQGVTPFLLLGGARLDFKDAFRATDGALVEDQNSLIAGGGVTFPISERVGVNLSVRDYIYSQSTLDSVASVSDLKSNIRNNWLVSAGLRFSVGGQSGRNLAARRDADLRASRAREQRLASGDSARADSTRAGAFRIPRDSVVVVTGSDTLRLAAADTIRVRDAAAPTVVPTAVPTATVARRTGDSTSRDFTSERTVSIPVPTEGELYVRYGPAGSPAVRAMPRSAIAASYEADMAEEELRRSVRTLLREEFAAERVRMEGMRAGTPDRSGSMTPALEEERLAAIERRLMRRVDAMAAARNGAVSDARYPVVKEQPAPVTTPAERAPMSDADIDARVDARLAGRIDELVERRVREELASRPRDTLVFRAGDAQTARTDTLRVVTRESAGQVERRRAMPSRITGYTGGTVSTGNQALLGVRADVGPINRRYEAFRIVPEIALGFGGGGRSTMVAGNVQYQLPSLRIGRLPGIALHGGAGLGLLSFSDEVASHDGFEAVLNLGYGATVDIWPRREGGGPALFIEHQGIDVYDISRLLAGLTWRF